MNMSWNLRLSSLDALSRALYLGAEAPFLLRILFPFPIMMILLQTPDESKERRDQRLLARDSALQLRESVGSLMLQYAKAIAFNNGMILFVWQLMSR